MHDSSAHLKNGLEASEELVSVAGVLNEGVDFGVLKVVGVRKEGVYIGVLRERVLRKEGVDIGVLKVVGVRIVVGVAIDESDLGHCGVACAVLVLLNGLSGKRTGNVSHCSTTSFVSNTSRP